MKKKSNYFLLLLSLLFFACSNEESSLSEIAEAKYSTTISIEQAQKDLESLLNTLDNADANTRGGKSSRRTIANSYRWIFPKRNI